MIVYTGHSPKYIAIAAPDLIECVPTSDALIPNTSSPIEMTADRRACVISAEVMCSILSCLQIADTGVSSVTPGYPKMRRTTAAHCLTGHRIRSFECICVTVSCLSSFFCQSKVIDTQSAYSRKGLFNSIRLPFRKKRMLRRRRISVLLFSA